jgi:hypothetical protein
MKKDLIREEAIQRGDKYYVPEKPCLRGHFLRKANSGECIKCKNITERNRYAKEPEKYRQKSRNYAAANKDKISAKNKQRWANITNEDHERINTYRKEHYQKTIEVRRQEKRTYYNGVKSDPIRYANRRSAIKASRKHPGRICAAMRRANKMQRTPKWLTDDENWLIREVYSLAAIRTKMHGFSWHVDHIIPLQGALVSGLHVPENLQVIPWLDNIKKANRYVV